jgi:hypothetical protein
MEECPFFSFEFVAGLSVIPRCGKGSEILQELCFQADRYQIILSLSPIFMPNGKIELMSTEQLMKWYGRFEFRGSSPFKREPCNI